LKILVTFYSRTGSTEYVTNKIAKVLKADLFKAVETKNRNGKLIYLTGGYEALREKLTDIKVLKSIQDYDMIVIGSPVWARKFTSTIRTFLAKNNFSNKMVALFATSKGDNPNSFTNIKKIIREK